MRIGTMFLGRVDALEGESIQTKFFILGVPLAWFPRLLKATPAQRDKVEISHVGLHWDEIDEDISIAGLLAGRGDVTHRPEHAA